MSNLIIPSTSPDSRLSYSDNVSINIIEFDWPKKLATYLDCVVLLDIGMGETDGSAVVGNNVWNLVFTKDLSLDLQEFECGLL